MCIEGIVCNINAVFLDTVYVYPYMQTMWTLIMTEVQQWQ